MRKKNDEAYKNKDEYDEDYKDKVDLDEAHQNKDENDEAHGNTDENDETYENKDEKDVDFGAGQTEVYENCTFATFYSSFWYFTIFFLFHYLQKKGM